MNEIGKLPVTKARNQSWTHMRASMLSSLRELLTLLKVLPAVLKVLSDATVEIGTPKMSLANLATTGYLGHFNFHHDRMSKAESKLFSSSGSVRYWSNSDFVGSMVFIPLR
jgi:hypothetical protein